MGADYSQCRLQLMYTITVIDLLIMFSNVKIL